jgi:Spy/CpxP family protein refolding chaperone
MGNRGGIQGAALAALATLGLGGTLQAALAADPASGAKPTAWHHQHGEASGRGPELGMLQVLRQLNLSDAQRQQVHSIISNAQAQWESQSGAELNDLPALGNPGDPNHAAAVQAAQARAAQRIQHWSDVEQQVYGTVLTADQKVQLPTLLTQLQTKMAARRSTHASK